MRWPRPESHADTQDCWLLARYSRAVMAADRQISASSTIEPPAEYMLELLAALTHS